MRPGAFFRLPGFLFSYDIITFDSPFFFSATFQPAYRRTYKYCGRFRIRYDVIRQIVKSSLPASLQNMLILMGLYSVPPVYHCCVFRLVYLKYAKGSWLHIKV
jgi:hypothetical protein